MGDAGTGLDDGGRYPDDREVALWPFYWRANPAWAVGVPGAWPNPETMGTVWGDAAAVDRALGGSASPFPNVALRLPDHVFPVVAPVDRTCRLGLMVPVLAKPAAAWRLSDAFGRFGWPEEGSVTTAFSHLLGILEETWRAHFRKVLPLRWRQPHEFQLGIPVHLDAIQGESLQWPLALALLRAAGSRGVPGRLPFGPGPVFATGEIDKAGRILDVDDVPVKLQGFLREYGPNRPLLLTRGQRDLVADRLPEGAVVHEINHLGELYASPDFAAGAAQLNRGPQAHTLDRLMLEMELDNAGVRFAQTLDMVNWLLPCTNNKPVYAFRLRMQRGQVCLHHGATEASEENWRIMDRLLRDYGKYFGADDRLALTNAWAEYWTDSGSPERALGILQSRIAQEMLPHASIRERTLYWGQCSQALRSEGRQEEAVVAGGCALDLARQGCGSLAGRFANFTVHALLTRARGGGPTAPGDLAEAYQLLQESREHLMPGSDPHACVIHLGFCRHYEAEFHRISGLAYAPETFERAPGTWDHPQLFTLLSAMRNEANPESKRRAYARSLLALSADFKRAMDRTPLFLLFHAVYAVACSAVLGKQTGEATDNLDLLLHTDPRLAGWANRLHPSLKALRAAQQQGAEAEWAAIGVVCDAIPYH